MIKRLAGVTTALVLGLSAPASAYMAESWYDMPLTDGPGLSESVAPALAYWSQVPGVSTDLCPSPQFRLSETNLPADDGQPAAGFGFPAVAASATQEEHPCTIWVEKSYLEWTDKMAPSARGINRCIFVTHELGHALRLMHDFRGDPLNIMDYLEDRTTRTPPQCSAAFSEATYAPNASSEAYTVDIGAVTRTEARRAILRRLGKLKGWKLNRGTVDSAEKVGNVWHTTVWSFTARKRNRKARHYRVFRKQGVVSIRSATYA